MDKTVAFVCSIPFKCLTAVGFEAMPLRIGAWSRRLRPLGQTVLQNYDRMANKSLNQNLARKPACVFQGLGKSNFKFKKGLAGIGLLCEVFIV